MHIDTRRAILTHGRLQHKVSFGFVQNAEIIVQVACFFFSAENKATVYLIFTDMPAVIISFLFTVHYC